MIHPKLIEAWLWCFDRVCTAFEALVKLSIPAVLLFASCGAPAKLREPTVHAAPFCFSLVADHYGSSHFSRACADSAELCSFARDRAVAFAEVAHFTEIGSCRIDGVP